MNRQTKRRNLRKFNPPKPTTPTQAEIKFLTTDDRIIMQFPNPTKNASFTKEQAVGLVQILVKLVGEMEEKDINNG